MPGSGRSSVRSPAQTGYRVDEHRLELFGLCPACLAAGADLDQRPRLTESR